MTVAVDRTSDSPEHGTPRRLLTNVDDDGHDNSSIWTRCHAASRQALPSLEEMKEGGEVRCAIHRRLFGPCLAPQEFRADDNDNLVNSTNDVGIVPV